MRQKQSAFSLIEMTVVLAILGLLAGGIMAGITLVRNSELKSVGTDLVKYKSAVNQFLTQYRWLPGDMTNATMYWGKDNTNCPAHSGVTATPGTCNGNGNRQITGGTWVEEVRAWQHLGLSGLAAGTYSGLLSGGGLVSGLNIPAGKITKTGYQLSYWSSALATGRSGNGLLFGGDITGAYNEAGVLQGEEAQSLDVKMDDGYANRGMLMAFRGTGAVAGCVSGAQPNHSYDLRDKTKSCGLIYLF